MLQLLRQIQIDEPLLGQAGGVVRILILLIGIVLFVFVLLHALGHLDVHGGAHLDLLALLDGLVDHGTLGLFVRYLGDLIEKSQFVELLHGLLLGEPQELRHRHQGDGRSRGHVERHGLAGGEGRLVHRVGANHRAGSQVAALLHHVDDKIQGQIVENGLGILQGVVEHIPHGIGGGAGGNRQGDGGAALDHAVGGGILAHHPALLHGVVGDPFLHLNLEVGIVVVVDVLQEHIEEARHLHILSLGKEIPKEEGIEEVADARQRQGNDDKSGNEGSGIGAAMLGLGLPRAPGVGTLAAHGALCRCAGSGALGCMGLRRLIAKAEGGAGVLAEFVQVPEHLRGALVALVQIGGHGVHGDLLQALGNLGI